MTADGLVLCDDLIFFSRIAGAARALGLSVRQAKSAAEVVSLTRASAPRGVILDLQNPGLELEPLLADLRALPAMPRVIAYGSHVLADALRGAREAGCDRVMPRSQFVELLDNEIAGWLGK